MDPSKSQPGSWRQAVQGEPKRRGGPMWRREETAAVPATGLRSRKARLAMVLAGLGIFGGLLVWVSFWLWPFKSAALVMIGSGYESNLALPVNVYGWQAQQDLADIVQNQQLPSFWGSHLLRLKHSPRNLQVGDDWDRDLDGISERAVVVYFSLHGGADSQGAYLLPGNADIMDTPQNRLRLEAIIARLGQLSASQHKLLILDCTAITACWPLGILSNDFARELEKLEPQIIQVPNLVVISASAADQRSWSSQQWRQSIFGFYLIQGLKGGAGDEDGDTRSCALDLFRYVRPNVENWVWSNCQAWQTPVLLPSGSLGEQRARQIDLSFTKNYRPPDPETDAFVFRPPPELKAAWQSQQQLMRQEPPPAAYAPQLWRQYLDSLLRYEELVRANSLAAANDMHNRLADLGQELERGQRLELSSQANSLAMPAAAGLVLPPLDADTRRQLDDLWSAMAADYPKLWKQLLAAAQPPGGERLLRFHTYQYLLDRAIDDPAGNLARVTALLAVVSDPVRPVPLEAHYAAMLARDLPDPPPPADLLQQSLRVMIQAEQAALAAQPGIYPYSEYVCPWIQELINQADEQRRLGQDLVFATEPAAWERGRKFLQKAEQLYQQAAADGAAVRSAMQVRDIVFTRLPYYSHWIVGRRVFDDPHHQKTDTHYTQTLRSLWNDAHQLAQLLGKPDPGLLAATPAAGAPSLTHLTESVRKSFVNLEQIFQGEALSLSDFDLQFILRHTQNTLRVPFLDADLRMQLLTNLDDSSRRLLVQMSQNVKQVRPLDAQRYQSWYQQQAQQQGQLALALLGQSWFDASAGPRGENYQLAEHRLETFLVESRWWESLAKVGDGVGQGYRRYPVTINQLVEAARQAKLEQARTDLQTADLLCRQLTGGETPLLKANPTELYRRTCMVGLLLWQTDRTLHDHWFARAAGAEPYYRVTGQLFVNDARQLDPRPAQGPARQEFQALQARLDQPGQLLLAGPPRQNLTSDQPVTFSYQLQAVAGGWVPPGYPVLWIQAGKELELLSPKDPGRLVRRVGQAPGSDSDRLVVEAQSPLLRQAETKPPLLPQPDPTSLTFLGVYRGQRIQQDTRINLYPLPDVAVQGLPLPQTGSVAVRADKDVMARYGASTGHIALVLDCSGSMGPPVGQPYGPTTKYNEALAALRQVLQQLPKGASVSLWVFGQAMGAGKTVEAAEKTVRRIQEPIRWDPADPNQLKSLMAKVAYPAIEPWNETPLVRAIVSAKGDLKDAAGFKSIIVITDGMDNRFAQDKELNPKKLDIPTFLSETFRDSGVVLNVVGYKVVNQEEKAAEAQFKVVETWPLPGMFVTVNDVKSLANSLGNALSQSLHYWVDREDNVPVPGPKGGIEVSAIGANNQWFPGGLAQALYKLRVHTDQRLLKNIAINRGDLLLVDLLPDAAGIRFERGLWSASDYPWKPAVTKQDWRLTMMQNQAVGDRGLQMLATLEKVPDPRETTLQVLRPRQTWIEVAPAGVSGQLYAVRWGYLPGYPAPAWGIDVPRWPSGGVTGLARPQVRAWWNPDQELIPATKLDQGADFQKLADLAGRTVPVEGDPVKIDGVTLEDHVVETAPGAKEKQSCLVVRLSHSPGKLVLVRPIGLVHSGYEHRFYTQIGAYTALFWPVTKEDIQKDLVSIPFYSLDAFKRDAERRGFYTEISDLKAPEPSDVRPRLPIQLK